MSQFEDLIKDQPQNIICPDCGATFSVREKSCPFCGHVNEIGDELAYQQKLEDIREDLEDLEDVPSEMYKEEAVSGAKSVGKITLIIASVLLILFIVIVLIFRTAAKISAGNVGKEITQKREYFASLDELYYSGNYEELRNIYNESLLKPDDNINIYDWDHNRFILLYMYYSDLKYNLELVYDLYDAKDVAEDLFIEDAAYVFYDAAKLLLTDWKKEDYQNTLTKDDFARLEEYKAYAADILQKHFHISVQELEELKDVLFEDSPSDYSPDFDSCIEYGRTLTWYR